MSEYNLAELEEGKKNALELMGRRDLALKLGNIPEFKKMILEDFCEKEAARLIGLSADPALTVQQRADALAMGQAAGHLRRYLSTTIRMGNIAENELREIEEAMDEARKEAN